MTDLLTAARLDQLTDQAEAFESVLLHAAMEGHGPDPAVIVEWIEGVPLLGDTCRRCGELAPCPDVMQVLTACSAINRALVALGCQEDVVISQGVRHRPRLEVLQ